MAEVLVISAGEPAVGEEQGDGFVVVVDDAAHAVEHEDQIAVLDHVAVGLDFDDVVAVALPASFGSASAAPPSDQRGGCDGVQPQRAARSRTRAASFTRANDSADGGSAKRPMSDVSPEASGRSETIA